jgi:hypothetical protein
MKEVLMGRFVAALAGVLLMVVGIPRPSVAQTRQHWEVEVFGGWLMANQPTGGTGTLPGAGAAFTTISGQPSRKVSTWYFGDGTELLNSVIQSLGRAERLTPLNPALNKATLRRENGGNLGFRFRRDLTARFAAEFSLQSARGRLVVNEEGLTAIEASRSSFILAWTALFATGAFGPPTITSVKTIGTGGRQLVTTGAVNFTLKPTGKLRPYVTGGAGVAARQGGVPDVELRGDYRALFGNASPISEHDSIKLHYAVPKTTLIGVVGGGVSYTLSRSTGLRGDVRFHLGSNKTDSLVDTTATIDPSTTNVFVLLPTPTSPTIQFRNFPPGAGPGTGAGQSTFGGPSLTDFRTFEGSGVQSQLSMTVGFFWRF